MSTPTADFRVFDHDRTWVSRYSALTLTMRVLDGFGQHVAADDDAVTLTYTAEFPDGPSPATLVAAPVPSQGSTGAPDYQVTLGTAQTAVPGPYLATWGYTLNGEGRGDAQGVMIGESSPVYDSLSSDMKNIVESVWLRMADLFDSPMGGPHLQVYVQTNFGRNRLAQLLGLALDRINTVRQPTQTYAPDKPFPAKWSGLLSTGLYIEVIKHLRRSYLEQPTPVGVNVARLDRSGYSAAWADILRDEEGQFRDALDLFKIASMGLGSGRVLVSGGAYPTFTSGPRFLAGQAAARGFYLSRGV